MTPLQAFVLGIIVGIYLSIRFYFYMERRRILHDLSGNGGRVP